MISVPDDPRARSIAARCLAKARWSITAEVKLLRSRTSPTARASVSATRSSRTRSQTLRATYAREAAEHFWPEYSNAPRTSAVRSTSGSALGWATTKSLPPVSPTSRG